MSKTTQKRHKIIRKTTASPTKCLRNGGFTYGAGEGNRTLVYGLGSRRSTIELHPHIYFKTTFGRWSY